MFSVLLCDVRSGHNVGAIFRTADAVGVETLYLGGITPHPIDRFGRPVPAILKTALGATESVSWKGVADVTSFLKEQKVSGVAIVVVELTLESVPLSTYVPPQQVCYVFGNEVTGVPSEVVALADTVVALPMRGIKESLNVAVTAGIVMYYHTWRVS